MPKLNLKIIAAVVGAAGLAAAQLLTPFEGIRNGVYVDPAGIKTVCVGHAYTGPDGKPLQAGQTYSDDVCSDLLGQDVKTAQAAVLRYVKVPISDGELAAYTSFTFNFGAGTFRDSSILAKLNTGDHKGACDALMMYDKAKVKGKLVVLSGLVKRRTAERLACLGK